MINTVVFFGITLLLLISLLSVECAVFSLWPVCSSLQFPVASVSFSPGNWVSTGLHCVLPKSLWHRKLSMSCSILRRGVTVSGWLHSTQTQRHLSVHLGWKQRVELAVIIIECKVQRSAEDTEGLQRGLLHFHSVPCSSSVSLCRILLLDLFLIKITP